MIFFEGIHRNPRFFKMFFQLSTGILGVFGAVSTAPLGGKHSRLFNASSGGVLAEERRLIDKVFSIVDKDNSGQVDIEELKGQRKVEEYFLLKIFVSGVWLGEFFIFGAGGVLEDFFFGGNG